MKKGQAKRYKLLPSLEKSEPPKVKVCIICHIEKPIEDFAKCKTYKDGHRSTCKECVNEVRREMDELNKDLFPF